jgi:hypothetical protein
MRVNHVVFLIVIAGLVFLGVSSLLTGLLALRFGLARGVRAIARGILLPLIFFGLVALLVWINPIEGEYRAAIWFIVPGLLGPVIGTYDVYRIFRRRREALDEAAYAVPHSPFDLSNIKLPPLD